MKAILVLHNSVWDNLWFKLQMDLNGMRNWHCKSLQTRLKEHEVFQNSLALTLLHSVRPKLDTISPFLSAIGLIASEFCFPQNSSYLVRTKSHAEQWYKSGTGFSHAVFFNTITLL